MAFLDEGNSQAVETSVGKATRGAFFLTISQGVFIICSFLFYIFLAKDFGPAAYGIFGFIFTVQAWLEIFVYGTRDASVKYINEYPDSFPTIYHFFIRVQLFISLGLTVLLYLGFLPLVFTKGQYGLLFFVAFLDLPLMGFSMLYQGLLNGNHLFRRQAVAYSLYALAKAFFIILFVKLGFGVAGALFGNVFSSLTGIVVGHILLKPKLKSGSRTFELPSPFKNKRELTVQIFKASIIFVLLPLFYNYMMSADLWIVNLMVGGKTSGYYMGALTISKVIFFLFSGFYMALFATSISSIKNNRTGEHEKLFSLGLILFFFIALPLTVIISINAPQITRALYGVTYAATGDYVSILSYGYLFLTVLVFLAYLLYAKGLYRVAAFLLTGTAIMYTLAVLILVHFFGAIGAAFGMTLTCFFGVAVAYMQVKKHLGLSWSMVEVGFSILLSVFVFTPLALIPKTGYSAIPASIVFLMIYFSFLISTKTLSPDTISGYARAFMKVERESALALRLSRARAVRND